MLTTEKLFVDHQVTKTQGAHIGCETFSPCESPSHVYPQCGTRAESVNLVSLGVRFAPRKMCLSMFWRGAKGIKLFFDKAISWSEYCMYPNNQQLLFSHR